MTPASPARRVGLRLRLALPLLLVLSGAVQAQPADRSEVSLRLEERQIRSAGIELARVEPETGSSEVTLAGQVVVPPGQLRVVAAPAAGLIETLLVAPDERVRAGQPVARLRSTELVEAQRLFLEAATRAELAAEKERRDVQLFRERVIAERRLLTARAESRAAAAALDERTQMLGLLGMAETEVAELRQDRRIRQALTVTSPMDGVVIGRAATPGERVAQAAPLLTVAQLEPLWINIQVPIARISALSVDSPVAVPAYGAEGFVLRLGRTADAATQSVQATALVNRGAEALRPGQTVTVALETRRNGQSQWRVPAGAVVRHRERSWVFVRTASGFVARPVQVVGETAQSTSLRGPLAAGDQVATRGMLALLAELAEADQS